LRKGSKYYFSPIPFKYMKMKNLYFTLVAVACYSCACQLWNPGKKETAKAESLPNDGQVHGVAPSSRYVLPKPPRPWCMFRRELFHMGPSDEDPAYAFSARNRAVSISGFWMDATEITNNEYRQL